MPQSVWVKTGTLQWWCDWKPHKWVDVRVALEQFTGHDGARDSILFIYYMVHEEKKVRGGARHDRWGCPWEGEYREGVPRGTQSRGWGALTQPQVPLVTAVLTCGDRVPVSGGQVCGGHAAMSVQAADRLSCCR